MPLPSCGLAADSYLNAAKCPQNVTLALESDPFAGLAKNKNGTT